MIRLARPQRGGKSISGRMSITTTGRSARNFSQGRELNQMTIRYRRLGVATVSSPCSFRDLLLIPTSDWYRARRVAIAADHPRPAAIPYWDYCSSEGFSGEGLYKFRRTRSLAEVCQLAKRSPRRRFNGEDDNLAASRYLEGRRPPRLVAPRDFSQGREGADPNDDSLPAPGVTMSACRRLPLSRGKFLRRGTLSMTAWRKFVSPEAGLTSKVKLKSLPRLS